MSNDMERGTGRGLIGVGRGLGKDTIGSSGRGRGSTGGRGGFRMSEGDWHCPNPGCGNINFARRSACNRCQTEKPHDANSNTKRHKKPIVEDFRGPPGLFQAGDWTCTICGNINWERRTECNICHNPKPGMAGLDEKRDGVAGGFNERQERAASAKTEIGEDGYDDFGVKKKKVKASRSEREKAALQRLKESYSSLIAVDPMNPLNECFDSTHDTSRINDDKYKEKNGSKYKDNNKYDVNDKERNYNKSKDRNYLNDEEMESSKKNHIRNDNKIFDQSENDKKKEKERKKEVNRRYQSLRDDRKYSDDKTNEINLKDRSVSPQMERNEKNRNKNSRKSRSRSRSKSKGKRRGRSKDKRIMHQNHRYSRSRSRKHN